MLIPIISSSSAINKPIDEKYIPETIARVEDIPKQVQADWNINDPVDVSYIENRPFYDSRGDYTVVENMVFEITYAGGYYATDYIFDISKSDTTVIINEETYQLSYDGMTVINFKGASGADNKGGGYATEAIAGDFIFQHLVYNDSQYTDDLYIYGPVGTHTLSVIQPGGELVQIKDKFIPDTIARTADIVQSDWNTNDENDPSYVKNRTHWTENGYTSYFPPTQISLNSRRYGTVGPVGTLNIVEGNTYIITIDDIEYSLVAYPYDDGSVQGIQFAISVAIALIWIPGNQVLLLQYPDDIITHTISIDEIVDGSQISILPKVTIECHQYTGASHKGNYKLLDKLVSGKTYDVHIDDSVYNVTSETFNYDALFKDGEPVKLSIRDTTIQYDLSIICNENDMYLSLSVPESEFDQYSNFSLSIYGEGTMYNQLDSRYIPDTIARVTDIENHTQSASSITEGTFAGAVVAQVSSQAPDTSLLRNSKLVPEETDPVNNGEIYWIYE